MARSRAGVIIGPASCKKSVRLDARYQRVARACKEYIAANYTPERIDVLIGEACAAEACGVEMPRCCWPG
jgi:hypothetical protein